MFGLGWALGLAATSLPVKELTLAFQILFSIFVGSQGILIFLLHGVRNQDVCKLWIQWFTVIGSKSRLTSILSSTKTSSSGPQSVCTGGLSSGVSTLPRKRDASASTVENTYSKPPYAESSMGGIVLPWRWLQLARDTGIHGREINNSPVSWMMMWNTFMMMLSHKDRACILHLSSEHTCTDMCLLL